MCRRSLKENTENEQCFIDGYLKKILKIPRLTFHLRKLGKDDILHLRLTVGKTDIWWFPKGKACLECLLTTGMVDWLHCNTCFKQPGPTSDGRAYFLTNCGHVFCDRCQDKGWREKCLFCGTPTPSAVKLTGKLTPPVDAYFTEPRKLMHKILTDVKQLIATFEFQDDQRKRLVKWLMNNVTNQEQRGYERMKYMERENSKLKEENNYLKKLLDEKVSEISYFKRLLQEKSHTGSLRSPSGDHNRIISPVLKGAAFAKTPSPNLYQSYTPNSASSLSCFRKSPGSVTPGRVSVRLPPSGGKLGIIPHPQNRTPTSNP